MMMQRIRSSPSRTLVRSMMLVAASACAAANVRGADDAAARLSAADALRVEGYYPRAVDAYRALRLDAEADAIKGLAQCHLETGRYAEAVVLLSAHADLGEQDPRWHMFWGEAARAVGDYPSALDHARRAVQLDARLCRARLLLCELLETVGRRDEAIAEYAWFERLVLHQLPIRAEDLTAVGQGFYRYSVLTRNAELSRRTRHVLTQIFQMAYARVDTDYWPARVAAADLLREKYNLTDATEDYRAALAINPHAADAHVGLGWIALDGWDFTTVERRVQRALAANPNHLDALALQATCKITERRYAEAAEAANRALAINPNAVTALALKAAALSAQGRAGEAQSAMAAAEAVNPCSGPLHAILADTLSGIRQFDEAEEHYRQAIACAPTDPQPRIELGRMYMQWGKEARAREVLDAAWDLDPFNERTKNTLELLDRLRTFAAIETDRYIIHYDRLHDAVVAEHFARRLDALFEPICAAFNAQLKRKPIIEIFPAHHEFAIRIHGKPWIHTIGACTGWVIAMDAPRGGGDLPGPYNFADVLAHEFTHTVTLAVSNNRVPHWLTEGLAVEQEQTQRPYPWKVLLADAVRRNALFPLEAFDWSFMRPRRPQERTQAYAQAEWMCEYLKATYGAEVVQRLLAGFAVGWSQPEVIQAATGVAPQAIDADFAQWARQQVAAWGFDLTPPESPTKLRVLALLRPDDAALAARLARAELDAGDVEAALATARHSVELDDTQNRLGLQVLLRALRQAADHEPAMGHPHTHEDEALAAARKLHALAADDRFALAALSAIHLRREEYDAALPFLQKLHAVWPIDPLAARGLAQIYHQRDAFDAALPFLLELADHDVHDAQTRQRIAEIHARRQRWAEARTWYERTLVINPTSEPLNERLAELLMQMGETQAAAAVYHDLCRIAPLKAEYHADCALAYHKLGEVEKMQAAAREAVRLDPQSPAAALLPNEPNPQP